MKKLAILGASYLQEPLIEKAKNMGIETHVFAWAANDIGEKTADYFYPISIIEKEAILRKCQDIGIDGICSISSDLAVIAQNYVAENMGLTGNSIESAAISTNKYLMRQAFQRNGDPSPRYMSIDSDKDVPEIFMSYPLIVKPVDRSGSRGVTKLEEKNTADLKQAVKNAADVSFGKKVIIEEFAVGTEYSVECLSWKGEHHFLAMTLKYTTGAPHFIETGHLEPAPVDEETIKKVKRVVFHALDSLKIEFGASHSELKISESGEIKIIEIGARMGGDNIGSSLVKLSTGIDFLNAVIDVALGIEPDLHQYGRCRAAAIRFILSSGDIDAFNRLRIEHPEYIEEESVNAISDQAVTDSSTRFGYFIFAADHADKILQYLPERQE